MRTIGIAFALFAVAGAAYCDSAHNNSSTSSANSTGTVKPVLIDPARFFSVSGHELRLQNQEGRCVLEHRLAGKEGPINRQSLALQSPCYFLTWRHTPDKKAKIFSGGVPVGEQGAPEAWRFASAKNATVLIVVGDQNKDDERYAWHVERGYHCGVSQQGVLLRAQQLSLAAALSNDGLHCVESGTDQKQFWILAHQR